MMYLHRFIRMIVIFRFVIGSLGHPKLPTLRDCVRYYFEDGNKSAAAFADLLKRHSAPSRPDVLEFASGYGCVSRHLAKMTEINCSASDIHKKAIDFLRDELKVKAFLSAHVPEQLVPPTSYDVVFVLSFFSHMPLDTWTRWLDRLVSITRPGGLIIFTAHGLKSAPILGSPEISDNGFWFKAESEQKDLPGTEYGFLTVTTHPFVRNALKTIPSATLVEWKEGFWWEHQDLYVLRRERPVRTFANRLKRLVDRRRRQ